MRVHEIAKELGVSYKQLVEAGKAKGIAIKSNLSTLTDEQVAVLKAALASAPVAPKEPKAAKSAPPRPSGAEAPAEKRAPGGESGQAAKPPAEPKPAVAEKGVPAAAAKPPSVPAVALPEPPTEPKPAAVEKKARAAAKKPVAEIGKAPPAPVHPPELAKPVIPLEEDGQPKPPAVAQKEGTVAFEEERYRSLQLEEREQRRRVRRRERRARVEKDASTGTAEVAPKPTRLQVTLPVSVREFSRMSGVRVDRIISDLMKNNVLVTVNHNMPDELVESLALEYGLELDIRKEADLEERTQNLLDAPDPPEKLKPRAPVITFLGHVDHGKTTLMDRIRKTRVAEQEAGGITQRIGAYTVNFRGKKLVFLDTPGHQAFTAMRARGANVTDLVVLVVAADDGVMPQTEEALSHARAADVKIVVAVNKVDKPQANPARVRQQLANLGVLPEEWGGKNVFVDVSALTGKGVEDLLELLVLEAELMELKANPDRPATGSVLESRMTPERGPVATLLVQNGTLRRDDVVLAGTAFGKIRALWDDAGRRLKDAPPATPVEVSGLSEPPEAGERFVVLDDIGAARQLAEERRRTHREKELHKRTHITLEGLFQQLSAAKVKQARFIVKADTHGSLEVLEKTINELSRAEVKVQILHAGVGGINESDVLLADASDAVIVGFNVVPDDRARQMSQEKGVQIRLYEVIYHLAEDLKKALEGMLEPEVRETIEAHAQVKQVFRISKVGNVAGCLVADGKAKANANVRVIRDNIIVHTGKVESLRRFQSAVDEVSAGLECGIRVANFDDVKPGDILELFRSEKIKRTLS